MQNTTIGKIVIFILILVCGYILAFTDFGNSGVKVYDCGMAEWHPDIPTEVKEECRRIRHEEWKKQQNSPQPKGVYI